MKQFFTTSLLLGAFFLPQTISLSALTIGTVNARRCVEQSKLGQAEQSQFNQLQKQLEQGVENKEKEINELKPKLNNEYLDTLTPDAERQLKERFGQLQQEHQELYYNMSMMLNKANYELMQKLLEKIQEASKTVANTKKIDLIINDEACFFKNDALDVSSDVITELDKSFAAQKK